MNKVTMNILTVVIVVLIFFISKPSDEKCRSSALQKLSTINVKATPNDILIKDYFVLKALRYVSRNDTLKLGGGFFFTVRISDRKLENIRAALSNKK